MTALAASARWSAQAHAQQPPARARRIQRERPVPTIESGKWTGKRLSDGQPDVQGHWSNTIANHNNWTDPQGGVPGDPGRTGPPKTPRTERAPSRVSDPPDGQVPFQPWARATQQEFLQYFHNPIKEQYIEPLARCAPAGVPKSFTWHGYEIRQFPGLRAVHVQLGHARHPSGRQAAPAGEHQAVERRLARSLGRQHADRRCHATTTPRRAWPAPASSSAKTRTSRSVISSMTDGARYNYVATFTDPTVFTRPWTATIPARRFTLEDEPDGWHYEVALANQPAGKPPLIERYERICVENNGPFGNVAVLSAK